MSKDYVSIIDVKDHVGEEVTIGAWVATNQEKEKLPSYNFVTEQHSSKLLLSNQTSSKNLVKK